MGLAPPRALGCHGDSEVINVAVVDSPATGINCSMGINLLSNMCPVLVVCAVTAVYCLRDKIKQLQQIANTMYNVHKRLLYM